MVVVRAGRPADAEGIARVHTRSWQVAYRGVVPDAFLDGLRWEQRREMWTRALAASSLPGGGTAVDRAVVVATDGGTVVGFAVVGPVRDDDLRPAGVFELYAIYLAPEHWGRGHGSELLTAALASVPPGAPAVSLWVLTANARGRRFYERQAFAFDGVTRVEDVGGRELEEMRYQRPLNR